MTASSHVSFAHRGPRRRRLAGRMVGTLAVAAVLAAAPAMVRAQIFLPTDPPTEVLVEDFEDETAFDAGWAREGTHDLTFGDWGASVSCAGSGHWGVQALREAASDGSGAPGALLAVGSLPESASFSAYDWTNIRLEMDFSVSSPASRVGFVWAASADLLGTGNGRDDAYVVVLENAQTAAGAAAGGRARWTLYKRSGDFTQQVATGLVELPPTAGTTVLQGSCYRLRLEWFCGNLQVSIRRFSYDGGCPGGCSWGCNSWEGDPCTVGGDPDLCWCSFIRWTDAMPLAAGGSGIFTGGTGASQATYLDNFSAGTWGLGCASICGPWSPFSEGWAASGNARDQIRFKHLFEGGLVDQRYGLDDQGIGRVDADVLVPSPEPGQVDGFCNGWRVLVDLPDPTASAGANVGSMRKFLEPIATAVRYEDDGNVYSADGAFVDTYNNDPTSPDYDPIPLVTSGTTPIAATLMDAYTWYVNNLSPGGAWADDPLAACRNWYVVLITDGEESCAPAGGDPWRPHQPDYACEPGQAGAEEDAAGNSFADPLSASGIPLEPVQVHVVGFSAGASTAAGRPPVACVADNTQGNYYAAEDASALATTLYDVINNMVEEDRAFLPIRVSPSPMQVGGGSRGEDLVLSPQFIPRNNSSIWEGHLYAFEGELPLNEADGTLDLGQAVWDAADTLEDQLHGASPTRHTFWPRYAGTAWGRVALEDVPANPTLAAEFKAALDHTGGVTDTELQEIVDFVRFVDASARPQPYPLGDIFHADPRVVSPPNNYSYFYNNVHDYGAFMQDNQHRRRMVLVGANDGLVHAFDAGAYDRDETDHNDAFDLGTGRELFSVLPNGVVDKLYNMTYGTEQQYLVDGGTVSGDVFITPPGGSDREWRTLAVTALQQGGRSYLALDVTHPDPPGTSGPGMPVDAACLDGTTPNCTGVFPRVAWEFTDTSDEDVNCPGGLTGDQCAPYWDLGATWAPPAIARVRLNNSNPSDPDDMFVAFFGGGWDPQNRNALVPSFLTGNFFYGVDVETGEIIYKVSMPGSMLPGEVTSLDLNDDGFHDRLYFGDTTGGLWRLDVSTPALLSGTPPRVTNWTPTKIYQFPSDQEFFNRPVVFPAVFNGSTFTYALAIGAGDRANLTLEDDVENRFYVVLDVGDAVTRGESDLQPIMYDDPRTAAGTSYLDPANGDYGWFLHLRADEKVNADALVAAQQVFFVTFQPSAMVVPDPDNPVCRAIGVGRLYSVWYNNGDPSQGEERWDPEEHGLLSEPEIDTSGGGGGGDVNVIDIDTEVTQQEVFPTREHIITNWRQE